MLTVAQKTDQHIGGYHNQLGALGKKLIHMEQQAQHRDGDQSAANAQHTAAYSKPDAENETGQHFRHYHSNIKSISTVESTFPVAFRQPGRLGRSTYRR